CYTTLRWGLAAGGAHQRAFHAEFAACMAREGRLRLSRLTTREGPVSVMYNVHTGDTVHYLQSGFDRVKARGLSLGYLHFGYAIEKACDEGAERFDFLAGRGRHRDYKRDLLTDHIPVVTYHVVRGATLRFLHAAHDIAARIGGS
ncbi:MAG: GNAT family N-acetyltransferase, partial [Steroidobacteraceae bacterium]